MNERTNDNKGDKNIAYCLSDSAVRRIRRIVLTMVLPLQLTQPSDADRAEITQTEMTSLVGGIVGNTTLFNIGSDTKVRTHNYVIYRARHENTFGV